jgi:prophage DNA circulation protein
MAAGTIITVLSNIPWGQVLDTAPKVADAAEKLWNAVTSRKKSDQAPHKNAKAVAYAAQSETEVLKNRLSAMEEHVLSLEDQMRASTELIKALAEQNTQLVRRIELNSVRLLWLAVTVAFGAIVLVGFIAYRLLWL